MPAEPKDHLNTPADDHSNAPQNQNPTEDSGTTAPLFARLNTEQAQTYSLVLASADISHTLHHQAQHYAITVPNHVRGQARDAIHSYLSENHTAVGQGGALFPQYTQSFSALYAALLLLTIHVAVAATRQQEVFIAAYGADARLILEGQAYRCVTALLLHSDGAHLLANMAGTLLFGTLVDRLYGWGFSWLLITMAGAFGNASTALWYGDHHLSIGASTGIFAALGLCAIMTFWHHHSDRSQRLRPWLSLAGALALLGWLGTSPRSDLTAHLFGFISGCCFGYLYAWRIRRPLSWPMQAAALLITGLLVSGSCWWGYIAEGA
jgi:rhomboid protease GluP